MFPGERTAARADWVRAIATIKEPHIFLGPDIGFRDRSGPNSAKTVRVAELGEMLVPERTLIVYRHQYGPKLEDPAEAAGALPYVRHGLLMLRSAGMAAFAYQSQLASLQERDLVVGKPAGLAAVHDKGTDRLVAPKQRDPHDAAVTPESGGGAERLGQA